MEEFRVRLGKALARGQYDGAIARGLATGFAAIAARSLVRAGRVPPGIGVVCVGGATLGGSGKTRIALACTRWLAERGVRVALVGHAYRACPGGGRVVGPEDALDEVGDEALLCARALIEAPGAVVVVGPTRQEAIDRAVAGADPPAVLVFDGPLRLRDVRSLSLLAVDAREPWGQGTVPPVGDLRAPREVLVKAADHVVPVDATPTSVRWSSTETTVPVRSLRGARLGLFTAIARPHRLITALEDEGLRLAEIVSVGDHGPVPRGAAERILRARLDGWLATEKCALHLVDRPARLGVLSPETPLPAAIEAALGCVTESARRSDARPG